ncbi:MAG TPA: deoxyribonuclease IV [Longimicrobiales bacterium]|nr:deoxyribonuclease IV [Longimicrobiales bacterium]
MTANGKDELGAHVSVKGGADRAPERAADIGAAVLQLFTKMPNRWADPAISDKRAKAFEEAREEFDIDLVAAHDSYLINLASPDETLWQRSVRSFAAELSRCRAYGVDLVVTHPGNATDRDYDRGIEDNALGLTKALRAEGGDMKILLEITAGTGTTIGATFENIAKIIELVEEDQRDRLGVCFDTCHAWAAGYDIDEGWDDVWAEFDELIGMDRLHLFHMNDSRNPLGSKKDRHAEIGGGTIGLEAFRKIMNDDRMTDIPKILETPKGKQGDPADERNLGILRGLRE